MTDFQVGDRVSVKGVVTDVKDSTAFGEWVRVRIGPTDEDSVWLSIEHMTLVDRPRRKLRVGSVWHPPGFPKDRYIVTGYDDSDGTEDFLDITRGSIHGRSDLTFDSSRTPWREVPVEELEREAADGS